MGCAVSAPILMRADVLPGLLAMGLPLASGELVVRVVVNESGSAVVTIDGDGYKHFREPESLHVDLRDPHTRDRVLRALIVELARDVVPMSGCCPRWIWAPHRPGRKHLGSKWSLVDPETTDSWWWWTSHDYAYLSEITGDTPDRDLLALRAVCEAVGQGVRP